MELVSEGVLQKFFTNVLITRIVSIDVTLTGRIISYLNKSARAGARKFAYFLIIVNNTECQEDLHFSSAINIMWRFLLPPILMGLFKQRYLLSYAVCH